jgi:hypothetical protein
LIQINGRGCAALTCRGSPGNTNYDFQFVMWDCEGHVIVGAVESLGIVFQKARNSYDCGYFKRGDDRLYLCIQEDLVDSFGGRRRGPSWEWPGTRCNRSGVLTFTKKAEQYGQQNPDEWRESAKMPLERLLARVVKARQYGKKDNNSSCRR